MHRESAEQTRRAIDDRTHDRERFRAALLAVPANERDAWVDRVLGIGEVLDDGPSLPRGCVPYLPTPVDDLLRIIEAAGIEANDVFVDVGAGPGRACALVHLLTGARAIGLEVQPSLVRAGRALGERLSPAISFVEGDAAELVEQANEGTVFFLYCPFGGARLDRVLHGIERVARARPIRVCALDLRLPPRDWLFHEVSPREGLTVHRGRPDPAP